jgi:Ig-like domain CHU_C associated
MCNGIFAQSSSFSVKTIICPNLCKGESTYQLVFEAINGTVFTNRGNIQNDTIVGILPKTDYKVNLTFAPANAPDSIYVINLPICDPIIPLPPIVSSQSLCNDTPITPLTAFTIDAATVDWYDKPSGGILLQSAALEFTPFKAGTYYAQARFPASGCMSLARTAASLEIKKAVCPVITIRKIRK